MYLKSIEVHGFKSFANKIHFQFHNGITGIVGPNGSGKSNVADAVRWVLGEQRIKQLRGASMQDVIFSGTETRKALSYAYVAITLDNSDHQLQIEYDEVTVARRIYRSGESEYLINGSPCRLKDVNELFYDTGIGKEGYSIIGQGQIDKILSGKPEERRELFDEAAGIVKFKKRKDIAEKKLEDEKQNLVRVKDILSELEKQIAPLEKQAEVAKVYLKKREELKTLDVNIFLLENTRLREQLALVMDKYQVATNQLTETNEQYEGIKEEYERIQTEIETLEISIEQAREQINHSGLMKGKLEGEINVLKEQIHSYKNNEEHLTHRSDTVLNDVRGKELEQEKLLLDKSVIDKQLADFMINRDEAKNHLLSLQKKIEELNTNIEVGKNSIIQILNERASIKSKLGRFDSMQEQIQIRRAELNSRLLSVKSNEAEQETVIRDLEQQFEVVTKEIEITKLKQRQTEDRLQVIKDDLSKHDQQLRDAQVLYHQDKSKLDALSNLTERYEGYGGSVKKVMEQKDQNKKLIGVVADIIKVDTKFETAIETALGGNIQNIVTEDDTCAKEMIQFLKQNKLGRATFLPLTSITKPQEFKNPEALKEKGVLGMADELVTIDEKYKNVAKAMLGRIVVVDSIDHALLIAKKYDQGIRMVTLEGELLVPGGAISGGAFKNNSNLLGRRREMEALEKQIKDTLLQVDQLLEKIEHLKDERNILRQDLEVVKGDVQKKFIEQNTIRMNLMKANERKEETEAGFGQLKVEQQDLESQMLQLQQQKEVVTKELLNSEESEKQIEKQIVEFQNELDENRSLETTQTGKLNEWELQVEKIHQKQEFEQLNVNRIQGELLRFKSEWNEISEKLKETVAIRGQKEDQIRELESTIESSHVVKSDAELKLKEEIGRKEELGKKQKNFFHTREEMSAQIVALDKEVFRLQAQKDKLEESVEYQINYMWSEYEITLSSAATLRNETMNDLSAMKREISGLKDQIKKLGDVNVNAIEDFKNLMERYSFLKEQHDDLVEAEATLLGIIGELDAAMRKLFQEKFQEINREFDKVFRELFGGGKGTLELMEDEDILEAGIRIIAQPPGKKLQNMMQLSGGEKALTAISLLFAIQNLHPSPFCLLDEIEAALDESNVGRFAGYLHKLSKNTQFIVITHRRGTMEKADRLYGITMQEKGVSALVSVNLIDKELDD